MIPAKKFTKYLSELKKTINSKNKATNNRNDSFAKVTRLIAEHKLELIDSILNEIENGRFAE